MKWFLTARHWQVFLALFLIPLGVVASGLFFLKNLDNPAFIFYFFPITVALAQASLYLWLWTVGSRLWEVKKGNRTPGIGLFKLFILIPNVIMAVILLFMLSGATLFSLGSFSMAGILYSSIFIIIPIQLLVILSMFYCFLYVAKTLKMAEENREIGFDHYFTEFVLIALLPIGIWVLQPRINRLAGK